LRNITNEIENALPISLKRYVLLYYADDTVLFSDYYEQTYLLEMCEIIYLVYYKQIYMYL